MPAPSFCRRCRIPDVLGADFEIDASCEGMVRASVEDAEVAEAEVGHTEGGTSEAKCTLGESSLVTVSIAFW